MDYDVIIVGAGASGLVAAIAAARQGSKVLVIEQKDKAGRKILATGNGKCNFTNMLQKPECYRSEDSSFAGKVLVNFDVMQTLKFFEELGIYPKNRDGYLYPNSEQASSIVQVLCMECERLGICFRFKEKVKRIMKPDFTVVTELMQEKLETKGEKGKSDKKDRKADGSGMDKNNAFLKTANSPVSSWKTEKDTGGKKYDGKKNDEKRAPGKIEDGKIEDGKKEEEKEHIYRGRKLILAAGGCASMQLGSDGSGYSLAESLGHTLIKPLPALVQLRSPDKYLKTVSGVRTFAGVRVLSEQKQLSKEEGEILFTDYGISGIPIMQISRFAARAMDRGEKVHLLLDFIPEVGFEDLKQLLQQRICQNPAKNMEEMLIGLFNHKLNYIILKESGIDVSKNIRLLTERERNSLVKNIKEFEMQISGTNSFDQAQVTAGGISTKEIQETTMESKTTKNLYLAGELMDVDGTCGGYNLQWAWTTGYLAGSAAGKV